MVYRRLEVYSHIMMNFLCQMFENIDRGYPILNNIILSHYIIQSIVHNLSIKQ